MGGGIYSTGSMARIEDCNIIGNIAGYKGGGIYCSGGHSTIKNCRIENNIEGYTSEDPGYGGGGVWGSYVDANHCIIRGNKADGYGGGIFAYDANLINCVINENQAGGEGGGLLIDYESYLKNCTIRNNEANGLGGGAYFGDGPINVTNCIFWGNADTEDTPGYQRHHQIYCLYPYSNSVNFRNCDIERTSVNAFYVFDDNIIDDENNPDLNIIGNNLGGNIHSDPCFADDYHLDENSPCINAGNNSYVDWAYDIDGDNRILNAIVDIGADEVRGDGGIYFPDYNFDNFVNFLDFAIFANAWMTVNPSISLDDDNDVDIDDLKIFCDHWLTYTDKF